MLQLMQDIALTAGIGIGATAVMDAWLLVLKRLGVASLNFAFIGRWVAHLLRGRLTHPAIAKAEPVSGELALGWLMHYATGIAFAGLLLGIEGMAWARSPTPMPALTIGFATVAIPLLLVQPAMGAGFAALKTPTPLRNCLKSLVNHGVFGLGLYLAAVPLAWLGR